VRRFGQHPPLSHYRQVGARPSSVDSQHRPGLSAGHQCGLNCA
jgi:hypothetical protein